MSAFQQLAIKINNGTKSIMSIIILVGKKSSKYGVIAH